MVNITVFAITAIYQVMDNVYQAPPFAKTRVAFLILMIPELKDVYVWLAMIGMARVAFINLSIRNLVCMDT